MPSGLTENPGLAEASWRLAFDAAGDCVWDWNLRDGRVACSENLREVFGDLFAEGGVPDWRDLLHADARREVLGRL